MSPNYIKNKQIFKILYKVFIRLALIGRDIK